MLSSLFRARYKSHDYLISSTTEISRRTIELKKLEKIIEFCNYDKCLRKYILDYFGEKIP